MLIIEKDILALGEGLIQGLDGTMITPEVKYCINFAKARRRLVLHLHYDGSNSLFSCW